jgi:hypothetical protein
MEMGERRTMFGIGVSSVGQAAPVRAAVTATAV